MSNDKILKSLNEGLEEIKDILKSKLEKSKKFPPGTIRNWGGKNYKKISEGKWEEVKQSKGEKKKTSSKNNSPTFSTGKLDFVEDNPGDAARYAKQFGVKAELIEENGPGGGHPVYEFSSWDSDRIDRLLEDYFDGDKDMIRDSKRIK